MNSRAQQLEAFNRLLDIMDTLREKCPWDQKQTLESLRHLTIEETYELADAILDNDLEEVKKELGDVLLHIVFYAKIGSEKGAFDIADIANTISDKLIDRHPHIYGDVAVKDEEEVKQNWEKLKLKEGRTSVLEGVPKSLPAVVKANRIQDKVSGVGFDWEKPEQVWEKVQEELSELNEEIKAGNNESDAIYNELMTIATDEKFKKAITKQLADTKKLAKGNPSPSFVNYENHAGGKTSLTDLKGKYVKIKYIMQLPTPQPQFAFFCNLPQYVRDPYKRFLENKLREHFDFHGVPISVYMRKK